MSFARTTLMIALQQVALLSASAQVVTFEGSSFPDKNWERTVWCDPQRSIENGWFVQDVEVDCGGPPTGDLDIYTRSVDEFNGVDFFIEWRVFADGDRTEITGVAPFALAAGTLGPALFHFTIARDQVRLVRGNPISLELYVDMTEDVAHTHRLEIYGGDLYIWYIDSEIAHSDVPDAAYLDFTPSITWGAQVFMLDGQVRTDYIRYGRIPVDASADFDSDGQTNLFEAPFIDECIQRSAAGEPAAPSCSWADTDGDGWVTCEADWQFIIDNLWTGVDPPPELPACVVAPIPAVSDWGVTVMGLLALTWGTVVFSRRHLSSPIP